MTHKERLFVGAVLVCLFILQTIDHHMLMQHFEFPLKQQDQILQFAKATLQNTKDIAELKKDSEANWALSRLVLKTIKDDTPALVPKCTNDANGGLHCTVTKCDYHQNCSTVEINDDNVVRN